MDTENPITQSIAAQIRGRRSEKSIPMADLSAATGIKVVTLSRYLNGKRDIPSSSFALICQALSLDSGKVLNEALKKFTG